MPPLNTDNGELTTSFTSRYVASLMFNCPTSPLLSMHAAVFTVSPQMSYWNFFTPTMPATTGPLCKPMRFSKAAWWHSATCSRWHTKGLDTLSCDDLL